MYGSSKNNLLWFTSQPTTGVFDVQHEPSQSSAVRLLPSSILSQKSLATIGGSSRLRLLGWMGNLERSVEFNALQYSLGTRDSDPYQTTHAATDAPMEI